MSVIRDFGAFELREKIGVGGMASVYLGVQKSLDRQVVLKVLHPHLSDDVALVQRFEREARAAAMLRHENIVQVIDCGRFEDSSYIAMEFVEGLDLKKWIETHGTPPVEMVLLMLRDICRGIEHAHDHRLVHRDIKPANIMLTTEGAIKIMDFGLARRGEDATTVTAAGSVLGTPAYMSPEQSTGESVDARSDIFSTGVVGYELLGGTRPFQGDSYSSVLREILTVEPRPLEDLNPLVPEAVVGFIHKCLQKDPARRYQRIELLRGDLETVIEQMGLHRSHDLLAEYAQDPNGVSDRFLAKRLTKHLDQGLYFEKMGRGKIDDALREYHRALYLDPENATAREHMEKLERERERLKSAASAPAQAPAATREPAIARESATPAAATPHGSATPAPAHTPTPRHMPRYPAPGPAPAPRPRIPWYATAVVITLIVGTGVFALVRGSGRAAHDRSAPNTHAAGLESQGSSTGTAPTEPTPTTSSPGETSPSSESASAALEVALTSLQVRTVPSGARISIDGEPQSHRSNTVIDGLAPGSHVVLVAKQGYVSQSRQVDLAAAAQGEVLIALAPVAAKPSDETTPPRPPPPSGPAKDGTLFVRVDPYASIFVDDQLKAENRVSANIGLKPGRYTIRAVHPQFEPQVWTDVVVESNKTTTLTWNFETSDAGSVRVVLVGGWAAVSVDGVDSGKTAPCLIENLPIGRHTIELKRDGFLVEGSPRTVEVKPGTTVEAVFQLKKKP